VKSYRRETHTPIWPVPPVMRMRRPWLNGSKPPVYVLLARAAAVVGDEVVAAAAGVDVEAVAKLRAAAEERTARRSSVRAESMAGGREEECTARGVLTSESGGRWWRTVGVGG
jgi:hypothetical protein